MTVVLMAAACGAPSPSQKLPGPTSASRVGLAGEVLDTVDYEYARDGLFTARTSPEQTIALFYDAEDRLALVDPRSGTGEDWFVYRYDLRDRLERIDRERASTRELEESVGYEYNAENRIALRKDKTPARELLFAYRYDNAGRLLLEEPMIAGDRVSYVYVDQGVLRHKDIGAVRTLYELDEHGNVLAETVVSATDETEVHERWLYDFAGWDSKGEEERSAPGSDTPYLSATIR